MYNMLKNYDNVKDERFAKRSKDSVEIKATERKFGRRLLSSSERSKKKKLID